jgi:phosphoribosylcarboxyaminoimidazole (NCAIR) mutase
MLAGGDPQLREKLAAWRAARTSEVLEQELPS